MILSSKRAAPRSPSTSSARVFALLTPTEEPREAGFTNAGRPSSRIASSAIASAPAAISAARTASHGTTGMPSARSSFFATSLSIWIAEPSTPLPT